MARGVGLGDPGQAVRGFHRRRLERLRARRADLSGGGGEDGDGEGAGFLLPLNEAPAPEEGRVGEIVRVAGGEGETDKVLVGAAGPAGSVAWVPVQNAAIPVTLTVLTFPPGTGSAATNVWTNMPAAATELFGLAHHRVGLDLRFASEVQIIATAIVAGADFAYLKPVFYDFGIDALADLIDPASGNPGVSIGGAGFGASGWAPINPRAKSEINDFGNEKLLRIHGYGGNGAADPQFGNIYLQFR